MRIKIVFCLCIIVLVFIYVALVTNISNKCYEDGGTWITVRDSGISNDKSKCVK